VKGKKKAWQLTRLDKKKDAVNDTLV